MSNADRPEFRALEQLEVVAREISEEVAGWRLRAHRAEAQRDERGPSGDVVAVRTKAAELERENADLRRRLKHVRSRVSDLLMRLRFLEEQNTQEKVRS